MGISIRIWLKLQSFYAVWNTIILVAFSLELYSRFCDSLFSSENKMILRTIWEYLYQNNSSILTVKFIKQIDGVVMGSSLSPRLVNEFLFAWTNMAQWLPYWISISILRKISWGRICLCFICEIVWENSLLFRYFDTRIREWFQNICKSQTNC